MDSLATSLGEIPGGTTRCPWDSSVPKGGRRTVGCWGTAMPHTMVLAWTLLCHRCPQSCPALLPLGPKAGAERGFGVSLSAWGPQQQGPLSLGGRARAARARFPAQSQPRAGARCHFRGPAGVSGCWMNSVSCASRLLKCPWQEAQSWVFGAELATWASGDRHWAGVCPGSPVAPAAPQPGHWGGTLCHV